MDNLIIFGTKYLIFVVVLISLIAWIKIANKNRWQFAAAVVLAGVTAIILAKMSGRLYYHPRPFVVQHIKPLISHGSDNGFPSEHTLLASTLAMVVYFYRRRLGIALLVLALLVGISRVLAHVHWAIDIIGSLILGALAGWVGYQLAKELLPVNNRGSKSKELESHT